MTHTTESLMELRSLYQVTGNIADINTMLIGHNTITELVAERDALAARVALNNSHIEMLERCAEKAILGRDALRAQLAELQSGDELPELPPFFDACGKGTAYYGHMIKDAMQSYARQAQAMARAKMLAELGKAEAIWQARDKGFGSWEEIDSEHANGMRKLGHEVRVLYTRPLPAQDVNAELVEALSASCHTEHLLLRGEVCRCSQCEFVRLRDTALANAKAAQQKEKK